VSLTVEQVAGLAPDSASLNAGRGLAGERRWSGLGRSERAVWGLCQGSGSKPYQTQVDLEGPRFRCSCPSRKVPCKHALGLLLLVAGSPGDVPEGEAPEWVETWLASGDERGRRARERGGALADPEAQARRVAKREERVRAGLEELERWLHDLVRQGLARARARPYGFWDEAAARAVDAQSAGLARRLRTLGGLAAAGGDRWEEALLEEAGLLQLLLSAYRRLDRLPDDLEADVRTLVGWTVSQDQVLAGEPVRDRWAVLAREVEEDMEGLRSQRVWLRGERSGRDALVLAFAGPGQPLDTGFMAGTIVDASLAFYPSAAPLRALVAERHAAPEPLEGMPGTSLSEALAARAAVLARQPWLWRMPVCLGGVVPVTKDGGWLAAEPGGEAAPLACGDLTGWRLLALSGGRQLALFGEWRRERVRPLSVFVDRGLVLL
jgi:hypothetical protein